MSENEMLEEIKSLSDEEKQAIDWFREDLAEEKENCGKYNDYKKQVIRRNERLLNLIEKQSKEIEELKLAFDNCFDECTSLRENFHKQIEISKNNDKKWEDKIKEKVIEIKNKPVKDEFITASQGKLDTIIEIESLLERK